MVRIDSGTIVKCDPQMKQFLLHLDQEKVLGKSFVIQDLDAQHLLISSEILPLLKAKIDDLMDQFSFIEVN